MVGKFYIVATPIGNLGDITIRAIDILQKVDIIACEDTRITRKLLNKYGISKSLLRYDEHTHSHTYQIIINAILSGKDVALVTDAGTPGLSDPGRRLIDDALKQGISPIPIPGASAITTILQISGEIGSAIFSFIGFYPNKKSERVKLLNELLNRGDAFILFLPPRNLTTFLKELFEVAPKRELVIGRELTKLYEEVIRGKPKEALEYFKEKSIRGEFVILIKGEKKEKKITTNMQLIKRLFTIIIRAGIKKREACKLISEITGLKINWLYEKLEYNAKK